MTRKEYDLNVSYHPGRGDADLIDAIAEANGFTRTGSGGGFGCRDIHYTRDIEPTETEIVGMRAMFEALTFPLCASIETWTYDENDEPVGDTTGEDLIDTLESSQ